MTRVRVGLGILLVVAGTVAILAGLGSAATVASIDRLVGRTGVVSQDMGTVSGGAGDSAIIIDGVTADIRAGDFPSWFDDALALGGTSADRLIRDNGAFVLLATPPGQEEAFLGLGTPADVDDYLFGHAYAVAELDGPAAWRTLSVPGDGTPGSPGSRTWAASAVGRPAELPAADLTGLTLVVMRPDAAAPVSTDLRLEYRVPQAPVALRTAATTAAAAGIGGLLLVLLGAWLVVGRRRGRHA